MPRRIARARSAKQFCINAQCGGEVRSNSGITRNLYGSLPLTSNSAIIYRCVVMYFCTGHGINRIMCVADAERIGA